MFEALAILAALTSATCVGYVWAQVGVTRRSWATVAVAADRLAAEREAFAKVTAEASKANLSIAEKVISLEEKVSWLDARMNGLGKR